MGLLSCYRGIQLGESLEYLEFMENAEEEEAWISERKLWLPKGILETLWLLLR